MLRYQLKMFSWEKIKGVYYLSAEASTLGLKPGQWPKEFQIENKQSGNIARFKFQRQVVDKKENQLLSMNYFGAIGGKPLHAMIFND